MKLIFSQIISQMIAFVIMLWILKRFAFKPVMNLLEQRKKRIEKEFAMIEEQKLQLKEEQNEYEKNLRQIDDLAKEKMQHHISKGYELAHEIESKAHEHARSILEKAKIGAARELSEAKEDLKNNLIDLTVEALENIVKEKIDPESKKRMVSQYFDEATSK